MPSAVSTIVGALACQRNSFLKSLNTSVVLCNEYPGDTKDSTPTQYAIELEDSILFPEGGGQPSDTGTFVLPDNTKIPVMKVFRDKLIAKHITPVPIEPGTKVEVQVEWNRRLDYMQQHTGQHLLSAVFDTYGLETLSWSMGEMGKLNYIELPKKINEEIITEVAKKVNDLIFEAHPILVVTPDEHGGEIDASHIPDDYDLSKGIVRVVKIGSLDANPCCGTHLQLTLQIQAISLYHQLNVRGGNSKLYFMCGSRVFQYLMEQGKILKDTGAQLSCQYEEIPDKVNLLNGTLKKQVQKQTSLTKELAALEAKDIIAKFKANSKLASAFRADSSPEYMNALQKEVTTLAKKEGLKLDQYTLIMANGENKTGGAIKITGPRAGEIGEEVIKILTNTKAGAVRGNVFLAKVLGFEKGEVTSLTKYFDTLSV